MSNLTVNNSTPVLLNNTPAARPAAAPAAEAPKTSSMANDVVKVQAGLGATLKGGAAGLLTGGLVAGGAGALMLKSANGMGDGGIGVAFIAIGIGAAGAIGGTIGGATAANLTDSKLKGAGYGALGGAIGGAAFGLYMGAKSGGFNVVLTGLTAAAGAAFGAIGGAAGAYVAKK